MVRLYAAASGVQTVGRRTSTILRDLELQLVPLRTTPSCQAHLKSALEREEQLWIELQRLQTRHQKTTDSLLNAKGSLRRQADELNLTRWALEEQGRQLRV